MNKNQTLVWITIIVSILIYSLNSIVHSKTRYKADIARLEQQLKASNDTIKNYKIRGSLLEYEKKEKENKEKYKASGNITEMVLILQKDNIYLQQLVNRYSNLITRNTMEINKYQSLLKNKSKKDISKPKGKVQKE
jgi:Na+/phosphate symporter